MCLRFAQRRKDGKEHRYWSIVESRRCAGGRVVQRPVLYLGEINDSQHAVLCRLIEAFNEASGRHRQFALFPAERVVPAHAKGVGVADSHSTGCRSGRRPRAYSRRHRLRLRHLGRLGACRRGRRMGEAGDLRDGARLASHRVFL
jgi:hypothetical protein